MNKILSISLLLILAMLTTFAQVETRFQFNKIKINELGTIEKTLPQEYSLLILDFKSIQNDFVSVKSSSSKIIRIPVQENKFEDFIVAPYEIMHPDLQQKFPNIKTFVGISTESKATRIYFSITDLGFHGMILKPNQQIFIDPLKLNNTSDYIIYERNNLIGPRNFKCDLDDVKSILAEEAEINNTAERSNGTQLRTYRLALACTGEYAATKGGTISGAMAGMVATMTRVNGVYETDLAIRMTMIANNNLIIYLNGGTDPYTNNNGSTLLGENQTNIDAVIGTANYDIGHVFSTGGGGVAALNSPCSSSNKARGVTGLPNPVGDAFDIDYVAHEMGHQFGGPHTFNSVTGSCNGNRSGTSAVEPGSGITIMAYAGICGADNLASNSIAYFHSHSINQILNFTVTGSGNTCAVKTPTGNNIPVATHPGTGYNIPISTPFALTGNATDADNDPLTYSWEEIDLGAGGAPGSPAGDAPIFRSFVPVSSPTRIFPKVSDLLNNTTTIGELLPTYARNLKFRMTVRDNKVGGGGLTWPDDTVKIQVINTTTPFQVTVPNTNLTWLAGSSQTVTWNVSSTNVTPILCANVRIMLSIDGGFTFPITLLNSTPNDGSEVVTLPSSSTTTARIKVESIGNIFFDLSNVNFTIAASSPILTTITTYGIPSSSLCAGQSVAINFSGDGPPNTNNIYTVQLSGPGGSFTSPVNLGSFNSNVTSGFITVTIPALTGSGYLIRVISSSPAVIGSSDPISFSVINTLGSTSSIVGTASICQSQNGVGYSIPLVTNATSYSWTLPAGASIATGVGTNSITVNFSGLASSGNISVVASNSCFTSSAVSYAITVNPLPSAAGAITGSALVCQGATQYNYSVSPVAGATGYNWVLPSGGSIVSGANTNAIGVIFSNAGAGFVNVSAVNTCGTGVSSSIEVNILQLAITPTVSATSTLICNSATSTLSFSSIANTFYQWQKNGIAISGETNSTYNATTSGVYNVIANVGQTYRNSSSVAIVDNSCDSAVSTINISGYTSNVSTSGITIRIDMTHTYNDDLFAYLQAPTGQILGLFTVVGGSGDNFTNTVFSDAASSPITGTTGSPFTGIFKPALATSSISACTFSSNITSFGAIGGGSINPNGAWKLIIFDRVGTDVGTINNWSISIPAGLTNCNVLSNSITINQLTTPAITSYTTNSGTAGSIFLINGTGFTGVSAINFFNNIPAAGFTLINDNQLSVTIPNAASTGAITITNACGTGTGSIFTIIPSFVTLNLNVFIQGFYTGASQMIDVLSGGVTDSLFVELHNAASPFALAFRDTALLSSGGVATCEFPSSASGNTYYIVVKHRNTIETWSKLPVTLSNNTNYNFTNAGAPRPINNNNTNDEQD